MSSRPEIGGFRGTTKRRELPPFLVLVQLRAGRYGRDLGRENSLPPLLPPWIGPCDSLSSKVSRKWSLAERIRSAPTHPGGCATDWRGAGVRPEPVP